MGITQNMLRRVLNIGLIIASFSLTVLFAIGSVYSESPIDLFITTISCVFFFFITLSFTMSMKKKGDIL